MKIRLKYPVFPKPDPKTGEYDKITAQRLIAAGLAEEIKPGREKGWKKGA